MLGQLLPKRLLHRHFAFIVGRGYLLYNRVVNSFLKATNLEKMSGNLLQVIDAKLLIGPIIRQRADHISVTSRQPLDTFSQIGSASATRAGQRLRLHANSSRLCWP